MGSAGRGDSETTTGLAAAARPGEGSAWVVVAAERGVHPVDGGAHAGCVEAGATRR
jgi:hypothetical protein